MRTLKPGLMGVSLTGLLSAAAGVLITDGVDYGSLPVLRRGPGDEDIGRVGMTLEFSTRGIGDEAVKESTGAELVSVNPFAGVPGGSGGRVLDERGGMVLGEILMFRVGIWGPERWVTLEDLVSGAVWTDIKPEAH